MFSFFLPILTISLPYNFPPYSIIYVCTNLLEYQIKQFEEYVRLLNNDRKRYCEINSDYLTSIDYCVESLNSINGVQFSTGDDINMKLSKVSKKSEFLFILCDGINGIIDFNNLKSELVVYISNETELYSKNEINKYSSINFNNLMINTIKSIQKITRNTRFAKSKPFFNVADNILTQVEKEDEDVEDPYPKNPILNISIEGNIKGKVSCLSISEIRIKIVNNDLNIHYFYIYDSEIDQNSKNINTTFFVEDQISHYRLYGEVFYKIHVDQFGLIMFDTMRSSHQIIFYPDYWSIISTSYNKYYLNIRHFMAKSFNWIICGSTIFLYPFSSNIGDHNLINISVIDSMPIRTLSKENKIYQYGIKITPLGNWSGIQNMPNITINFDPQKFYLIHNATVQNMFSITEPQLPYSYIPKKIQDDIKKKKNGKLIGYICGVVYVVVISLILIIIAIIYRPKKESLSEDEFSNNDETNIVHNNEYY